MRDGLAEDPPADGRHMLMLPSFVTQLPTGEEAGECYAMDVGGTHCRVMHVRLGTERHLVAEQDLVSCNIPLEVRSGPGVGLFDFMAAQLAAFMRRHLSSAASQPGDAPIVGLCFSFPCSHTALDAGTLISFGKGFTCGGVVGRDPVKLLAEALKRAGLPCRITALVNDTVAVLAAARYLHASTEVALILGTGTNACYMESVSNIRKWASHAGGGLPVGSTHTVVATEWGAFDSPSLPRVGEDALVDSTTGHAGRCLFEKLLSGMFLGEVARRILLRLCCEAALFGSCTPPADLLLPDSFPTATLAAIADDRSPGLDDTAAALQAALKLHPSDVSLRTRRQVRAVCRLVALRSAKLVALALSAVLTHGGWYAAPRAVVVAVDGGVYEHFQGYRTMLSEALRDEMGAEACRLHPLVTFQHFEHASCLGAAVLAAAAAAASAAALASVPPAAADSKAAVAAAAAAEAAAAAPAAVATSVTAATEPAAAAHFSICLAAPLVAPPQSNKADAAASPVLSDCRLSPDATPFVMV